jgi:isopentenyldiphosphate isomerase
LREHDLVPAFGATYEGTLQPDPLEVAAVDLVDVKRLRDMVRRGERPFTPTFVAAWSLYEKLAEA